jgi:ubiquinone/menaquinone biosynthesis C-methylase UbiE
MTTEPNTAQFPQHGARETNLPMKPHRCPWWMQYLLVSPLRRLLEPAGRMVGPHVESGMTVLDPGCGFGYVSLELARRVGPRGRVVCVDVEPRAVERLRRRAAAAGLSERIDARACSSRDLGLADCEATIDLVTVIHTLHEFEDLPGFLAQVRTVLRPNGRMLVVEPRGHVTPEQFEAEVHYCKEAGLREVEVPTLGARQMVALFARAGES